MYGAETGSRTGPADMKAAKAHMDLGRKLAPYASLAAVDEETIKRVLSATGGVIDRSSTPEQIRTSKAFGVRDSLTPLFWVSWMMIIDSLSKELTLDCGTPQSSKG